MSRQTGKAFHFYIEVILWASSSIADVIWRSIGNTITVLNIEAKSNNDIYVSTYYKWDAENSHMADW